MASTAANAPGSARMQQNWVIDRSSDGLFIIVAPLISLIWAVSFTLLFGPEIVLTIFAIFNIAHHLPTFIRIYGDRDLLRRFRWSLLLGPVLPFSLAMCVVAHVVLGGHHMSNVLYLLLILQLWDPWHFLRQHYGFMRIYDRNNRARRELSSRMDFMICSTWFAYIMVATLNWMPDLLYDTYRFHGSPLLFLFDDGVYGAVQLFSLGVAVVGTVAYLGYLAWCRANGYFVSPAKITLLVITFGVMLLTYVPNPAISRLVPDWNFALGFAVLGMVHVTQYLAIVWKYNRRLSGREGAARRGLFQELFSRGDWNALCTFVLVCLLYGFFLASSSTGLFGASPTAGSVWMGGRWLVGVIFALAFTSTLLHYYYDGFIWKVRHKENQQYLGILPSESRVATHSWWEGVSRSTVPRAFFRQCLYFVPPIVLLSATFWTLKEDSIRSEPIRHAVQASGTTAAAATLLAMESQLEIERTMIRIRPRSKHYTYQADLLYTMGNTRARTAEKAGAPREPLRGERRRYLAEAIASLESALEVGPPYGHAEDPELGRDDVEERLRAWRLELAGI
jgi:hypothetical protein